MSEAHYVAIRGTGDYDALPVRARQFQADLLARLSEGYAAADTAVQRHYLGFSAVLDRLGGFLLQMRRMIDHKDRLITELWEQLPGAPPGGLVALRGLEATTDFESLLFHGRAVLDQLTLAIARSHGQNSDRFSKLGNLLSSFSAKDERARRIVTVLSDASRLEGVLTDLEARKGLRALISHRETIAAGTTSVFTVQSLPSGKQLVFDCDAFGYDVFGTTHMLAAEVPFVVLNGVSIYLGGKEALRREDVIPSWDNPTVRFSEWIDPSATGPLLTIVTAMNPDGFEVRREHLRPEVFNSALATE